MKSKLLPEEHATFDKMERIADFYLPGHDAKVLEHEVYPY